MRFQAVFTKDRNSSIKVTTETNSSFLQLRKGLNKQFSIVNSIIYNSVPSLDNTNLDNRCCFCSRIIFLVVFIIRKIMQMIKFRSRCLGMFYKILSKMKIKKQKFKIQIQFFENFPLKEFILLVKLQDKSLHFL